MTKITQNHSIENKISVVLVHGFLGSGKTTFLKNLIEQFQTQSELKIGLLMNDFGEASIDAMVLNPNLNGGPVIEVNNGSIFCACRHDQFIEGLIEIAKYSIDFLFIEAGGLSDPSPFLSDLAIVQKKTNNRYLNALNISIVDVGIILEMREITPVLDRQIKYANVILLNKIDLLPKEQIDHQIKAIIKLIRQLNSNCLILQTTQSKITLDQLFSFLSHKKKILPKSQPSIDTEASSPLRVTLKSKISLPKNIITEFFNNITPETLRIKGFLCIDNEWYYVDGINGHYSLQKLSEKSKIKEYLKQEIRNQILIIFRLNTDYELTERVKKIWDGLFK